MSEVVDIAANGVENVSVITPVKSIIITKSIKSLTTNQSATATSPTALAEKNSENIETTKVSPTKGDDGKILTEAEKLEQRIKKFGVQSENAKLSLRAQRFGQEVKSEDEGDKEKLKEKRAQRFGITSSPSKTAANGASAETLEKRAKRFGTTATTEPTIEVSSEALTKRKERFGFTADEAKKKLRSERFENKA